jgi:putative endonuclease
MRKMKTTKRKSAYYVYIVKVSDGTYYTGHTSDLEKRLKEHGTARGAKYLRGRTPVKLVYVKEYKYHRRAVATECDIKNRTRKEKEELIRIYERHKER